MAYTNCIVCLQKSAEIPPEYLQFSNQLLIKLLSTLSNQINGFVSDNDTSFPLCSLCRIDLAKFAKLNDKLETLASDLCQPQKQTVKIRKISLLQRQTSENCNYSNDRLESSWNDQPTAIQILQPDILDTREVETVDNAETNEKIEIVEIIDFVQGDSDVASNFDGSQANDRPLPDIEDENDEVASSVLKTKCQAVDTFVDQRGSNTPTRHKLSKTIEQLSDKDFIYGGKFPFEKTDAGFKCKTCSTTSRFCKDKLQPSWNHIYKHMRKWHAGSGRTRKIRLQQRFTEIAPDRFQYGNYVFEKSNDRWRCLTCDHLVTIGRGEYKFKYISFHLNTKHENPGKHHICELCGTQLSSSTSLKRHNITQHAESNASYPCSSCVKTFKTQIQAREHEKSAHSGRCFNFICEICGQKFRKKVELQGHIGFSHNGERPFKCNDCGNAYANKTSLCAHQNSHHTGKRKYICDVCGMNFTQSYSIKRHKMTAHKN